ncbi:uncharacterized protein Tco025E_09183 [Trypanosoma conorhini]|uniref:Uncharacterized protein n=1 Tax=Trypanosoma conorhini TaxID=83891 RepID=A0A3R7LJR6_9TRYP|nr:uncharacterized protein Tco025E_09183 [Trypanosoma conorhini]RNE98656.1 hypothetical protein Tco025E_09183 [Trypanosoma conorhini]
MGAAPSRESRTLYSYFRGTYEIGLIPLTKAFFGLTEPANAHSGEKTGGEEGLRAGAGREQEAHASQAAVTAAHIASVKELRRQFILMRGDPAILYANARGKASASWPELLSDTFTEEDLDAFLDAVEAGLYNSDAEMIADIQTPLLPLPCALCLVCKDGQERSGCFFWHGRSIVVIGYLACLKEELRRLFKVAKRNPPEEAQKPADAAADPNRRSPADPDDVSLFLNAGVLASAGDRTLERVLLLAAVMVRNQYLDAFFRVRSSTSSSSLGERFQDLFNIESGVPSFSSLSCSLRLRLSVRTPSKHNSERRL